MGLAILLVEDDLRFAKRVSRYLAKEGHQVEHAAQGEDGVLLFAERTPDVVLLDLLLPGKLDGLQALEKMRALDSAPSFIVMTGHGSLETAVRAMRLGAVDYLTKPVDLEALSLKLDRLASELRLRSDLGYLLERDRRGGEMANIVGDSPQMKAVYEKVRQVAKTESTTVLITGETGTGKELIARAIHSMSARGEKPLIQIDCTTIPLPLMESELFGHERGAFSGADRMKRGLLELADQGTLLLDEIGDMDVPVQAKLLRVLEERAFRRVGGTRDIRFDVRVVAATNQDLDERVRQGRFRQELLYRLKVFQIDLPPLRDRGDDILELATMFAQQYARSFHKPIVGLDEEASQALQRYRCPGNVRELRNMIEQAVILARGEFITRDLLPIANRVSLRPEPPVDADQELALDSLGPQPLRAAEREIIRQAMGRTKGNKKLAAKLLGISRFALQRKLEKMDDEP